MSPLYNDKTKLFGGLLFVKAPEAKTHFPSAILTLFPFRLSNQRPTLEGEGNSRTAKPDSVSQSPSSPLMIFWICLRLCTTRREKFLDSFEIAGVCRTNPHLFWSVDFQLIRQPNPNTFKAFLFLLPTKHFLRWAMAMGFEELLCPFL